MFDFMFGKKKATMSVRQIDSQYHVSGQITPETVAAIKKAGYTAIVCMRPDNEGYSQPSFADIKIEADAHDIAAHYLPVSGTQMPIQQATQLKQILRVTPGPVLAYCASGGRASMVYQLSKQIG
jgi:sulfide:quinone oxidoreductase